MVGSAGLDERHQPIGVRDKDGCLKLGEEGRVKRYVGAIENEPDELDQMVSDACGLTTA